ncbi:MULTISPECIES: hypothetical protein [unclassified Rhodococcus (in: high G+C Gram-positive bacteria)]|uniref:hypothetical protein n=1 Tax=unclassified Rhodococcus (in: high G+C Gram-positive bacteria) TaxID=192944 RepID=UPI0006F5BA51|nr:MULTISPECIES: hypothetical protein [unclassified Rhodococcus (in: high G+C Gram-positive bacteria)]KQU30317.1 hypothetical protein ASG69_04470 [Rhodococcus sp. Leaf225]KQU44778.1 hypothetical protein ASH03_12670 [Rhodococcus sp. Leaf258]
MSSPARYQPVAAPPVQSTASQATQIEQSRAVAEVQAAVLVAQQNRRNKSIAVSEMREATSMAYLAEKAFFRFPRGGETVTGPSIHLARELARCWGNIQYGLTELRRDDAKGESEMQAYAWDLETNARNSSTFIVPHIRDTKRGAQKLTEMRDIYENNANAGSRRVREAIFAVLPNWFTEEAQDLCRDTLTKGGGVPLAQRIANSIKAFEGIGVTRVQLETKLARKSEEWTEHDVTQLGVTYKSIQNGEVTKDQEFEATRVTADEIKSSVAQKSDEPVADMTQAKEVDEQQQPADGQESLDGPITEEQGRALAAAFKAQRITTLAKQVAFLSDNQIADVTGINELTAAQAAVAIDVLQ